MQHEPIAIIRNHAQLSAGPISYPKFDFTIDNLSLNFGNEKIEVLIQSLDSVGWSIVKPKKEYRTISEYKKYSNTLQTKLTKANLLATKVIHSSLDLCIELLEDSVHSIYENYDYHQKGLDIASSAPRQVSNNPLNNHNNETDNMKPIEYLLLRLPGNNRISLNLYIFYILDI